LEFGEPDPVSEATETFIVLHRLVEKTFTVNKASRDLNLIPLKMCKETPDFSAKYNLSFSTFIPSLQEELLNPIPLLSHSLS
jgi:hypothetical protein